MDTLFENYEYFIREHTSDITSPSEAIKLIADKSMFESYIAALTQGLEPHIQSSVVNVCNRQRRMLLHEAANVPAATFGFGWTVLSLPILVDIYSEPIIAELCNVYTTDTPIASIPRIRIYATTTHFDGTTTERIVPTARNLVRPDVVERSVVPGVSTNLLVSTFGSTNARNFKMNRRYLMVDSLSITCESSGGSTVNRTVSVNIRPDNRAQLLKEFTFLGADGLAISATFQGNVNWDNGVVFYNVIINDDGTLSTDTTVTVNSANYVFRFTPVTTMIGRTKVMPKIETTDVTIDMGEDFLIDLTMEDVQD